MFRKIPLGYSIAYIPKGPIGMNVNLLNEIDEVCKSHRAVFLKVEPFGWEPAETFDGLMNHGFRYSTPIQPRRTVLIDLLPPEEEILSGMKQKTRYNIRLAEKKGIEVKESRDYDAFHAMSLVTGERDNFGIHTLGYYLKVKELFEPSGQANLLMAYFQGKPVAGIIVMLQGKNAWYLYGASTEEERNRMPTYLLQWEAIKWAKARGCQVYDLWGIPDQEETELEALFTGKQVHDGLWGVYRFKRGFGGAVKRSAGAWDKPYSPGLYRMYQLYTKIRRQGMEA